MWSQKVGMKPLKVHEGSEYETDVIFGDGGFIY